MRKITAEMYFLCTFLSLLFNDRTTVRCSITAVWCIITGVFHCLLFKLYNQWQQEQFAHRVDRRRLFCLFSFSTRQEFTVYLIQTPMQPAQSSMRNNRLDAIDELNSRETLLRLSGTSFEFL